MNRTGLLVTLLLFSFTTTIMAQKMKVESFVALSQASDPDAKDPTFRKRDTQAGRSGQYCAIIKVVTTAQDKSFSFELGSDFVPEAVEYKDNNEIWVYVPAGTNKMKISHQLYGQLDTSDGYYYFSSANVRRCEAATVYRLRLHTDYSADEDIIKDANRFATVSFRVEQPTATIRLRGVLEQLSESGRLQKQMPLGIYHYRVTANDYHYYDGVFELTNEGETKTVNVQLKQAFGWITLDPSFDIVGCTYTIDDTPITLMPAERMKVQSGTHSLVVKHPHYRQQTIPVLVEDSSEYKLMPHVEPIFGKVNVSVMTGATVKVDGKEIGKAPMTAVDVIIGEHKVEVSYPNYRTETRTIIVREGETTNLSVDMVDMAHFTFSSTPSGAKLYVDNEQMGVTPCSFDHASGNYKVKLTYPKYRTYEHILHFDSSDPTVTLNMERQYVQPFSGYVMAVAQVGSYTGFGATIGGYVSNVNAEVTYLVGGAKSEKIFWNYIGSDSNRPKESVYSPNFIGAKVGYGITIGARMRLTPQIGMGCVSISSSEGGSTSKTYAMSASIGTRFEYVVTQGIGVSAAPELAFAASQTDTFKALANLSSKIKGWSSGFNLRIGAYLFF